LRGLVLAELERDPTELLRLVQAHQPRDPLVDEVTEVPELVSPVAQSRRELDPVPLGELDHRRRPHRALEVHVEIHLRQRDEVPTHGGGAYRTCESPRPASGALAR
jgi:hypothetical protein